MIYEQSDKDKEEADQLRRIANGSIKREEAEAILTKLFPLNSILYSQVDAEFVLAVIYQLPSHEIDKVMEKFPESYNFDLYRGPTHD